MGLRRLRFDKARINLGEAAIVLATSQEGWASYVYCSVYDYCDARYDTAPSRCFAVMPDFYYTACDYENDPCNFEWSRIHRVQLIPDYHLMPGWVQLEWPGLERKL